MSSSRKTMFTLIVAISIVVGSSLLRAVFFSELGRGIAYLTYYPGVMIAALVGGLPAGLLATFFSAFLCYYWIQQGYLSGIEWFAMTFFILICGMISFLAGAMKRANARAKKAKEEAEAANKAKSIFLANMSHELRTPLNAVIGFSQMLSKSSNLDAEEKTNLGIISRSGEHLLNLINNILDISKIESGRIALEEREIEIYQLLHEIQAMMQIKAHEKGLYLTTEISPDCHRAVKVDSGKLRQVLINLIGNAIKYTNTGGISVRLKVLEKMESETIRLRFEVEDSGSGITEEDQKRIFTAFVQLENQFPAGEGAGLGLAICKQNVELMHGHIGLDSTPGEGSLFYFELPVQPVDLKLIPTRPQHGNIIGLAEDQPQYRILVAEDKYENRLLLLKLLEPLDFEIKEATNGIEAVEIFTEWQPHLIWMDIRMPQLDGLEATRRIRADEKGKATKIIALTAHALEDERNEILAAGCDDFIRKPYHESEIFNALEQHLNTRFLYENSMVLNKNEEATPELTANHFKKIPEVLIQNLMEALELLNTERLDEIITRISEMAPETSELLHRMIEDFQHQQILAVLDDFIERNGYESK